MHISSVTTGTHNLPIRYPSYTFKEAPRNLHICNPSTESTHSTQPSRRQPSPSTPLIQAHRSPPTAHHEHQVPNPFPPPHTLLSPANPQTRVRTLTGKEIELDIEPDYKVSPLPLTMNLTMNIPSARPHPHHHHYQRSNDFKLTPPQVSRIKERVEEKEGIPPVQQRLIFGGKQMYETTPSPSPPAYTFGIRDKEGVAC